MKKNIQIKTIIIYTSLALAVSLIFGYYIFTNTKEEYSPVKNKVELQDQWLNDKSCQSPCWRKITPGRTTLLQAVDILLIDDVVSNISIRRDSDGGLLEWDWTFPSRGGINSGRLIYDSKNVIYAIEPNIIYNFSLKEAILKFGEPSHIIINVVKDFENPSGTEYYSSYIVWLDHGLMASGSPSSDSDIGPDYHISSIVFYEANLKGLQNYMGRSSDSIVPWQGYKSEDDYIRNKSAK
jgi:hypothetical protein